MGLRFRKSIKIGKGYKLNLGKKSVGASIGNRGGGISFNSKSGVHVRASIPGTGISFTQKIGKKRNRRKNGKNNHTFVKILTVVIMALALSYLLPILIPVFIIALVGIFIFSYRSVKKEYAENDLMEFRETVLRKIEIMNDCVALVNDSCNFSTVSSRYNLLITTLSDLAVFTDEDLRAVGVEPSKPFRETLSEVQKKKDTIFNQAIKRAYDDTVVKAAELKTEKGRRARLDKFKEEVLNSGVLSENNIVYLESLF